MTLWKDANGIVHIKHPNCKLYTHCEIIKKQGGYTGLYVDDRNIKIVKGIATCIACLGQSI